MRTSSTQQVLILSAGSIVEIDHKLPGSARTCTGVSLGCSAVHSTKALARVGLGLNNGKDATYHRFVYNKGGKTSSMPGSFDPRCNIMPLYANGFVQDLNNSPTYPYTVFIHFELSDNLTC
jgi:hypothetical protein